MYTLFYYLVTGKCPFDSEVKYNDTGECYTARHICDGYYHCTYGNDEENCGKE